MNYLEQLNDHLNSSIPLVHFIGLKAVNYSESQLVMQAPLKPNDNDKGTAFAGSIYSSAVLCGWSSLWLICRENSLNCDIAIYKSSSKFIRPITDEMELRCQLNDVNKIVNEFIENNRVNCDVKVELFSAGKLCAVYSGKFAIRPRGGIR